MAAPERSGQGIVAVQTRLVKAITQCPLWVTLTHLRPMSALPPKADILRCGKIAVIRSLCRRGRSVIIPVGQLHAKPLRMV